MLANRRLLLNLSALMITLVLVGCGSSHTSQGMQLPTPTYTPILHIPSQIKSPAFNVPVYPAHLVIPAIGLNASVEPLGILADGNMATPTQSPWNNVGWYSAGPLPGEKGSAVIDGHLDRPGGYPAVFWHLSDLHIGDKLMIVDVAGNSIRFHVTRIMLYEPKNAPIQDIFGNVSGSYLNLITCAGDWIPSQHQTTLRLVVYTSLDQ